MSSKNRLAKAETRTPVHSGAGDPAPAPAIPPPPERALPVSLLRAREAVMHHMRPILRAHGVTEQQWRVLRALDVRLPLDKTTLSERATLLMPSLLRILKDTERAGWVRLVQSTSNARLSGVVLTAAGKAFVDKVSRKIAIKSAAVKRAIGEEDVAHLLELLEAVEVRLRKSIL